MSGNRTYRVPKRVQRQVDDGAALYRRTVGARIEDVEAIHIAAILAAGAPVDGSIAQTITDFFTRDWKFHQDKTRVAGLYGGESGRLWAEKCVTSMAPLTAATTAPEEELETLTSDITVEELLELTTFTSDDLAQIMRYGRHATVGFDYSANPAVGEATEEFVEEVEEVAEVVSQPGVEVVPLDEELPGVEIVAVEAPPVEAPPGVELLSDSTSAELTADGAEGVAVDASDDGAPKVLR